MAADDLGRERLVRYCTRPPFALDRIEVLRDGRSAYAIKTPRRGRTHRVMTPMEFMARLAALIHPPKIPFVRYHGVFASRSSWRALVTPKPPMRAGKPKTCEQPAAAPPAAVPPAAAPSPSPATALPAPSASPVSVVALPEKLALGDTAFAEPVVHVEPTTISVAHWGGLDDGELFARTRHLGWAVLLKRTFGFAALKCPRCSRKMRAIATITEPPVVRKILEHLGVRASPLPRAPARDPSFEQMDLEFQGFDAA